MPQTVATPKWYAFPDNTCGAAWTATYRLQLLWFLDGNEGYSLADLQVKALPDSLRPPSGGTVTLGRTTHPVVRGLPTVACTNNNPDDCGADTIGTLTRTEPEIINYVPLVNQFRNKVQTHEEEHKRLFQDVYLDYRNRETLLEYLKGFRGPLSCAGKPPGCKDIQTIINEKILNWHKCEFNTRWVLNDRWRESELLARARGDEIPPFYLDQAACMAAPEAPALEECQP